MQSSAARQYLERGRELKAVQAAKAASGTVFGLAEDLNGIAAGTCCGRCLAEWPSFLEVDLMLGWEFLSPSSPCMLPQAGPLAPKKPAQRAWPLAHKSGA